MAEIIYHSHGKEILTDGKIKGIEDFRQFSKKTYGKHVASYNALGKLGIAPAFEIYECEKDVLHVFYKGGFPEPQIPKNCKKLDFEEFKMKLQEAK